MGGKECLSPNQTPSFQIPSTKKYPVSVDHKWHWQTKIQIGYRLTTQDDQVVHQKQETNN